MPGIENRACILIYRQVLNLGITFHLPVIFEEFFPAAKED